MLSTLLTVALFLNCFSFAATLPNIKRDPGLLRLPVVATNLTDLPHASKRQEVSPLANTLTGTLYLVDGKPLSYYLFIRSNCLVSIGTPPQQVSLLLDTGSSETWVNPTCSTASTQQQKDLCNSLPIYDPAKSTTSKDLNVSWMLNYGKGSAKIEYFKDNFLIGGK